MAASHATRVRDAFAEHAVPVTLRVLVVVAFPALVAWLAKSLGYYESIPPVPVAFLHGHALAWQTLLIGGVVGVLALIAVLSKRPDALVFGVATGAVLWLGFPFSELRWYRFVPGLDGLTQLSAIAPSAWLAGAFLIACASVFVMGDAAVRTRRAYAEKALPAPVAAAAERSVARGAATAVALGLVGSAVLALVASRVSDGARSVVAKLPHVNPVIVLFLFGVILAIVLHGMLRPRDVRSGSVAPLFAARTAPRAAPAAAGRADRHAEGTPEALGSAHAPDAAAQSPTRKDAHFDAYVAEELRKERERREQVDP